MSEALTRVGRPNGILVIDVEGLTVQHIAGDSFYVDDDGSVLIFVRVTQEDGSVIKDLAASYAPEMWRSVAMYWND